MSSSHAVIRDLDVMEQIVAERNDLSWDGWDIIHYKSKPVSFMNPKAVFKNGEWRVSVRYPVESYGWRVPRRLFNVAG